MELPYDVLETLLHRAHTGQYINSVAHDLNNLIGASMAYAELVEMDATDPEVKRMVGEIVRASEKSAELLNAITTIARPLRIDPDATVSVSHLFDALDVLYAYECKLTQVQLEFLIGDGVHAIATEQHMAQRILMRIIDNAMEANRGSANARVSVTAERSGDTVRLVVADSGHGISDDVRTSLFEPRFTTKEGHIGMGLATARDLAGRCGATLDYEVGTGFVLTVPRVSD